MEEITPQGEFHHFQLVNSNGEVPVSISVLVHYNQRDASTGQLLPPIETEDVIQLHDNLQAFDGDFIKAFEASR